MISVIDVLAERANLLSLSEQGRVQLRIAMPVVEVFDKGFFLQSTL